eukprot:s3625_g5.t1
MKSIDQKFLAKAAEIALFRDERKGRILLRFRAVTEDLDMWCGMLGQERDAGTGGLNLTAATEKIIRRACGRWFGAGSEKQQAFVKLALFKKVCSSITTITVDSALDELLSGEMMRTSVLTPDNKLLCPNLRSVIRDKAHSSRRLTSRPWSADETLKETIHFFCGGPGSVARLIQHSPEIRRLFESFSADTDNTLRSAVVNFRSAQHRFESHTKPLGRTCLFLHACVRTCLQLFRTRTDNAAKKAKLWIQKLDDESALLAAMLADAADSSLQLTRKMDSEEMDPATITQDICHYLQEIQALFVHGEVLQRFGYTSTMLQTLKQPLVYQLGPLSKCLGSQAGVKQEIKDRCLTRMKIWVKLAKEALEAEFPSFELGQAYKVFNLETGRKDAVEQDLARIAQICQLNKVTLQHQWLQLASALRGCYEVSPGLLLGSQGCALKLFNAACIQRALLISEGSRQQSGKFWSFLRLSLPAVHAWVLHAVDVKDMRQQQARFKAGVAFLMLTEQEVESHKAQFAGAKNVYTITSFRQRIRKIDAAKSVTGLSKDMLT